MEATFKTADEVINALGGTTKTAIKLGKGLKAVSMWKTRGRIPPELFLSIDSALEAEGLPKAAPEVFGMAVPIDSAREVAS